MPPDEVALVLERQDPAAERDRNVTLHAGELFVVQNNILTSSGLLGHPVVELALDSLGSAWYLTTDLRQTVLGPGRSKASPRVLPSSVAGAWFDARGDAWLADRTSSGFFIAVPEAR